MDKTNAMRILDKAKIKYIVHEYSHEGGIDGVSVAKKLGQDVDAVFKTLVCVGADKNYYVFVIPVSSELDLKLGAKAVGVKNIMMIPVADINKVTGYIRGGCSPVGMKKLYTTVFDESVILQEQICVSGGKIGMQIEVGVEDLTTLVHGKISDITAR